MSYHARPAALATILVIVSACSGYASGATAPPPAVSPSASPAGSPSASPGASGTIEHTTGGTDVLLRYDQGGGFVMPGFLASQAPIFTLYGDGTVVFRNPASDSPPPIGNVFRSRPFRTAKLSEEQIQATLEMAIGLGDLGIAKPTYTDDHVADAGTTTFTLNAGGLQKTVSVYALGIDVGASPDAPARAAFQKLAERLADFDHGGTITTQVFEPARYRGILMDGGPGDPAAKAWPWPDLKPSAFAFPADPNVFQLAAHALTPAQVEALGVKDPEGGFQGMTLIGPGGKFYSFSLRPLLPDEAS